MDVDQRIAAIIEGARDEGSPSSDGGRPASKPLRPEWPVVFPSTLQGVDVPARSWCLPDWIPDKYVTLFSGDGGTGKSTLAMQLATSVALGRPFLGLETAARRVLYYSAEDDLDEMHRRQNAINGAMRVDFADFEDRLVWKVPPPGEAMLMEPDGRVGMKPTGLLKQLTAYCVDEGVQLVIIDTLADTFGGLEIDRQQVTRFVRALQAIAQQTGGAVLLLGHPSASGMREGGNGTSGSTAWRNAVRSVIGLKRDEPKDGATADRDARVLESLKGNYAPAGGSMRIRYEGGAFFRDRVFDEAATKVNRLGLEASVLAILRSLLKNGVTCSPHPNAKNNVISKLMSDDRLTSVGRGDVERLVDRMTGTSLRIAVLGRASKRTHAIVPADYPPLEGERAAATGEDDAPWTDAGD